MPSATETLQCIPFDAPEDRDLRIREQVLTAFQESGYHRLCRLTCLVFGGAVLLKGRVSAFYLKQLAQTLAMQTADVRAVQNEIVVE